jgi:hypothetical protein
LLALTVLLFAIASLSACGNKPQPSSQAETVYISVYRPLPPSDILKTVGDWALLDNGELIHIETTKLAAVMQQNALPIPESHVEREERAWDKKHTSVPKPGGVAAILDRKNGLICIGNNCARTYAICPPWNEMRFGKKCSTFSVK